MNAGTWRRRGDVIVLDDPSYDGYADEPEEELNFKAEFEELYRRLALLPLALRLPAIRRKIADLKAAEPTFTSQEFPADVGVAFVGLGGTVLVLDTRTGAVGYRDAKSGAARFRWQGGRLITSGLPLTTVVPAVR